MITFFGTLIRIFFHAFRSKRIILSENALLKKGNTSCCREWGRSGSEFDTYDHSFFNVQRPHQGASATDSEAG
jgi:hypothetical protein